MFSSKTSTTPANHPRTRSSSTPGTELRHISNEPPSNSSPIRARRATTGIDCFVAGQERTVLHATTPPYTLASLNVEQFISVTKEYLTANPKIELYLYNKTDIETFISHINNKEKKFRLKCLKHLKIPIVTEQDTAEVQELVTIIASKAELFPNLKSCYIDNANNSAIQLPSSNCSIKFTLRLL